MSKQIDLFDLSGIDQKVTRQQYEDKIFGAVRPTPQPDDKCWYYDGSQYVLMVVTSISKSGKTFRCIEWNEGKAALNRLCAWDVPVGSFKPFSKCPLAPIF